MKRVALHTLGCKLNFTETSTIGRQFVARGYESVGIDEAADVVVINTCSVTERADRECRQLVRRALRHSPHAYVVVMGCYAQLRPEALAAIPGVDLVLGTAEKLDLFEHVQTFAKRSVPEIKVGQISEARTFVNASSAGSDDRTRAFLKIQDGCDYSCSFCTIPLARGESRSVSASEIIAEARSIVDQGYKEIVLTGVNVGDYGSKIGTNLLTLLQGLTRIDGLKRLRVSSIEPNLLTNELLDFWLSNDVLCKHFHIPLQSGADEILKKMRRRYLRNLYEERVLRIHKELPDACIGSDVISGFPGETNELFEETYQFLLSLPLSYLHPFTYSERPNTKAIELADRVEPRIRFERTERLRNLSLRKRIAFHSRFAGKEVEVLFEAKEKRGCFSGLTGEYVKVTVYSDEDLRNQLRRVRIDEVDTDVCMGQLIDEAAPVVVAA
ncbi:MAG TPA: tRNA (N(6)-L-threonylcarbamoyladenosine(37)-C(2))-methylthiotransferase MtaB [Bacteroidota bacterium]|nr:tRNA (N(6)-L-threonylcarbamoyladenosine(37)-C(2))-methylthiotransferase MtaB [Bacteroidota bacterium]